MILWPRIDAISGETAVPPALCLGLSAASREAADAPPVEMAPSPAPTAASPDPTAASPDLGSAAPHHLKVKPRTRLLAAFALLISTGLHAAVLAFFLDRLSQAGVEAETDAVSVEIVLEAPPAPTVAASAPAETQPDTEAAPPETEPKQVEASGPEVTAPVDQPGEEIAAAAPDPAETEPVDVASGAPVEQSARIEQASAAPMPPNPGPPARAQRLVEQLAALPRDPAAELTPPLPMPRPAPEAPEVLPPQPAFAQAAPPEVDAPVPSPRPAYQVATAKADKRKKETAAAQPAGPAKKSSAKPAARSKAAQKPRKQTEDTARSTASAVGPASARGGASAGAAAKYGQKLLSHVQRHKRYPEAAARQKISGATKLAITIDRSGRLAGARVAGSSGHAILDDEAVAVARRAAPYPRPPEGVGGETISFSVTLRFKR